MNEYYEYYGDPEEEIDIKTRQKDAIRKAQQMIRDMEGGYHEIS